MFILAYVENVILLSRAFGNNGHCRHSPSVAKTCVVARSHGRTVARSSCRLAHYYVIGKNNKACSNAPNKFS